MSVTAHLYQELPDSMDQILRDFSRWTWYRGSTEYIFRIAIFDNTRGKNSFEMSLMCSAHIHLVMAIQHPHGRKTIEFVSEVHLHS